MGNYGLQTIYSFEAFANCPVCKGFPVYQSPSDNINSVYIDSSSPYNTATAISNPMKCNIDEFWAGTSCKPTNVLFISSGYTPGLVIPIKSRLMKNLEWTIETWVYVVVDSAIASIEGDSNCMLSIRSTGGQLAFDWLYGSTGIQNAITTGFSLNAWHYVALTARLDTPNYVAEAILDLKYSGISSMIIPSNKPSFKYFVLGTGRSTSTLIGKLALKEIRLWSIAFTKDMLAYQMRNQVRQTSEEINLVFYYKIESDSQEELINSAFEGNYETLKLWSTPRNYTLPSVTSDVTVVPPQVIKALSQKIIPLIICDEFSYYNSKIGTCEKDYAEYSKSLELSLSQFIIPLDSYNYEYDWTMEFWIKIKEISGVDTAIFRHNCVPACTGAITIKKVGISSNLVFLQSGTNQNITFPLVQRKWVHYAFMNNIYNRNLTMYINGILYSQSVNALVQPFVKCPMLVGESSTMNIIYGKLKEFRVWNGTRTFTELQQLMHLRAFPSMDNRLVVCLPINEGSGINITELISNTSLQLPTPTNSREAWTSQGDIKLCIKPYVYDSVSNVCKCILKLL